MFLRTASEADNSELELKSHTKPAKDLLNVIKSAPKNAFSKGEKSLMAVRLTELFPKDTIAESKYQELLCESIEACTRFWNEENTAWRTEKEVGKGMRFSKKREDIVIEIRRTLNELLSIATDDKVCEDQVFRMSMRLHLDVEACIKKLGGSKNAKNHHS